MTAAYYGSAKLGPEQQQQLVRGQVTLPDLGGLPLPLLDDTPCAPIASLIAIYAGSVGSAPFSGRNLLSKMVILQTFNGTVALTALLLSAITAEGNQTLRALQAACDNLAEALSRLLPDQPLDVRPTAPAPSWDAGAMASRWRRKSNT